MTTIRFSIARFAVVTVALSCFSLAASAQNTAPALTAYYGVKEALVATDGTKAKTEAAALSAALSNVESGKLSVADKTVLATAKTQATAIGKTRDVETQREAFELLSTSMIALTKATKPAKAYVQFCPMKNATWLSDKKDVRNPYYGDKMLKCGSVKEEI